jgi:hypothetical protein
MQTCRRSRPENGIRCVRVSQVYQNEFKIRRDTVVDLSRPSLLLINRVAVDKLAHSEFAKNWIASGSSTNDFSEPPGHFLSPDFRLFSEKPTFFNSHSPYHQQSAPAAVGQLPVSLVRHSPTSPIRSCPPCGLWPSRTGLVLSSKTRRRSPGSRACCFSACAGS